MLRHTITACSLAAILAWLCGCAQRSRPLDDAPAEPPRLLADQETPATQPVAEAKVIAKWLLEPGAGRIDPVETVPLVLVMDDGRVRIARSLFTNPFPRDVAWIEGQLTTEQLEHFKITLTNLTEGLGGQSVRGPTAVHWPYHQFVIDLPSRRTRLQSSFRVHETDSKWGPVIDSIPREGWNQDPNLSRFQKLSQNYDPADMAIRETFIAVEAEFLRAAAQAMINRALDEGQGRGD